MSDFQQEIVEYAKKFYQKKGKAPSISLIIKGVKNCSRTKIYNSFKGIEDICSIANIPYPKDRIDKIKNLNISRKNINHVHKSKNSDDNEIKFTKDQILRINTISHLEKGKSQSKIIDNLLNLDSLIREDGLDHNKIKIVSDHIEGSRKKGMEPQTLLNLEDLLNKSGFINLNEDERKKLNDIAMYLNSSKLSAVEFIQVYNRYIEIINIVNGYNNYKISYIDFVNRMKQL